MSALRNMRVLVVENDEMNASLLQLQLASQGALVVGVASTVQAALELLVAQEPHVVFLDYWLAGNENSVPVAVALCERGIPFVLATGMPVDELPDVFNAGVKLAKPYLGAELTCALQQAIESASVKP